MTTLLAELDNMLQEKEQRLLMEKNNALMFLKIERIASILKDGGFALTPEDLANFAFLSVKEVTDALDWMTRGAKHKALPFELNSEHQPKDTLSRVIAGLVWIESRSKSKRGSKPLPPEDTKVIGVQRVMQLTGLGRMDVLNAVAEHKEAILKDIPEFRAGWRSRYSLAACPLWHRLDCSDHRLALHPAALYLLCHSSCYPAGRLWHYFVDPVATHHSWSFGFRLAGHLWEV